MNSKKNHFDSIKFNISEKEITCYSKRICKYVYKYNDLSLFLHSSLLDDFLAV